MYTLHDLTSAYSNIAGLSHGAAKPPDIPLLGPLVCCGTVAILWRAVSLLRTVSGTSTAHSWVSTDHTIALLALGGLALAFGLPAFSLHSLSFVSGIFFVMVWKEFSFGKAVLPRAESSNPPARTPLRHSDVTRVRRVGQATPRISATAVFSNHSGQGFDASLDAICSSTPHSRMAAPFSGRTAVSFGRSPDRTAFSPTLALDKGFSTTEGSDESLIISNLDISPRKKSKSFRTDTTVSDRGSESSFGSSRISLFSDQLRKADKKDIAALQNKLIESNERNALKDHRIGVLEVEIRKLKADGVATLKEKDDVVAKLQAKVKADAKRIRRLLRNQDKVVQDIEDLRVAYGSAQAMLSIQHQIVEAAKETADENDRANANLAASRSSEARLGRENDELRATLAAEQAIKLMTQRELCELRCELQVVCKVRDKAQAEAGQYQAAVDRQHQELTQARTHERELETECQKLLETSARDKAEIEGLKDNLGAKDAEHENQLSRKDTEYAEGLRAKDVEIENQRVAFEKEIAQLTADLHSKDTQLRDLPLVVVTQHDQSGMSASSSSSFAHPTNDASTHLPRDHVSFVNIGQDSASFWASEDSVTTVRPSHPQLAVRPSPILPSSMSENKSSLLRDASSLEIRVSSTSCDLVHDRISLPGIDQVSSSWASARDIGGRDDAHQVSVPAPHRARSTHSNRPANTSDNLFGGQTSLYALSPDTSSCWRMPPGAPEFPHRSRPNPPCDNVSISSTSPQPSLVGERSTPSLEIPRGVGSFDLLHDNLTLSGLDTDSFGVENKASAVPTAGPSPPLVATPAICTSAKAALPSTAPEATFEIPSCQASFNIVHDKISLSNADADSFWVGPPAPSLSATDKIPPTPHATAPSGELGSLELPSDMGSFNLLHDGLSFPLPDANSFGAGVSEPEPVLTIQAQRPARVIASKAVGSKPGPSKRAEVRSSSKLAEAKSGSSKHTEGKTTRRPLARLVDAGNTPARPRRHPARG